jgi:hypothetical protein
MIGYISTSQRVLQGAMNRGLRWAGRIGDSGLPPIVMSTVTFEDDVDEETPFIQTDDSAPRKPTPLPKTQISILLTLWIAEAVVANSITPYINQVR